MARTLLDALNQQAAPLQQQAGGELEFAQKLTQGLTGKAPQAAQPGKVSLQEQLALQTGKELGEQQRQQGLAVGEQLSQAASQQQKQAELTGRKQTQQKQAVEQEFARKSMSTLKELDRNLDKLSTEQRGAKLEQLGTEARLSNKQYIDKLNLEGAKSRLNDKIGFKEQAYKTIFDNDISLFKDNIAFKKMQDLDDDQFKRLLAQIDINTALEMARQATKQQNLTDIFTGGTKAISAYAEWDEDQKDKKDKK